MTVDDKNGFTLIEVVATLIIIGIISAVVISRGNIMDVDKIGDLSMVKSHLRYAQNRAMADRNRRWGVIFTGSNYALYRDGDGNGAFEASEKKSFPGADSDVITLESSLSCNATIAFDWWGAPYNDAACSNSMVSGTLSFGSGFITITPVTGFVP
jgi:MSHA pilin protein MshC